VTICPVCNNGDTTPYSDQSWSIFGEEYRLLSCETCNSVSTFPLPSDAVLSRLYAECFDYRWYQDHIGAKLRDCRERIREYRPCLGKRVLDFGGGIGYLSAALRDEGYDSITYDPFCRRDDQKYGLWDTVIALHVLEHANDPDRTLSEMKELLAPGGNLILAVPNAGGRGYRELGMKWVWAQPPVMHVLHFTASGLTALLERNGFSIETLNFAERWDANLCTDLDRAAFQLTIDSAWGRLPYNRYRLYRKGCAVASSLFRSIGLQIARQGYDPANTDYSELQVIARVRPVNT
jgi:SAM-dependent methyltransferase